MKKNSKNSRNRMFASVFFSVILTFCFVFAVAYSSTTISTNIDTGGKLTVAGLASLNGNASTTMLSTTGDLWVGGSATTTGNLAISGILTVTSSSTLATTTLLGNLNLSFKQIKSVALENLSSFPLSPVTGQTFWSTATSSIYAYTGTNWKGDVSGATFVVAASDSKNKEKADYICDGTDDQDTINTAINAASPGGRVVLLEGIYYIASSGTNNGPTSLAGDAGILINDTNNNFNITLEGQGMGTILKVPDGHSRILTMIYINGASATITGVKVKNLQIDGNKTNVTGTFYQGIGIDHASNIDIENVYLSNGKGDAGNGYGFWVYIATYVHFRNCTGLNWDLEPMEIRESSLGEVTGCTLNHVEMYDLADYWTFSNNIFIADGISVGTNSSSDPPSFATGNKFNNNTIYGSGFAFTRAEGSEVSGNVFYMASATDVGVSSSAGAHHVIANNAFYINYASLFGIAGNWYNSIITGNNFYMTAGTGGSPTYAIGLQASTYNTISDNYMYNSNFPTQNTIGVQLPTGSNNNVVIENTCYGASTCIKADGAATNNNNISRNHFYGKMNYGIELNGTGNIVRENEDKTTKMYVRTIDDTGSGNFIIDQGSTGNMLSLVAEATVNITASASVTITLNIPSRARLKGVQLRVDSALTNGELWDAAYSGGSATVLCSAQAVAQSTKCNKMHVDEVTTDTTNIVITKNGGGSFTAQGTIRAIVYYDTFSAMSNAQ